ncbi:MAG: stage II sporulation protein M [Planctomycetales bacterium]|nr:stage II sporulation protein M [Planctomycetales bacterium]
MMRAAELLARRQMQWQELDGLCEELQSSRISKAAPATISRFASLYRAACADLALADAYQLPPDTVLYLHRLVGRAHNQLYRSQRFDYGAWGRMLIHEAPKRIFQDRCVQLAFMLFWSVFLASSLLANAKHVWPEYVEQMLGEATIHRLESDFGNPILGRDSETNFYTAAMYIRHNTGIGLKCFAGGLLFIPGLFITTFNAASLGAAFGYMARADVAAGETFFEFVRAHGPFELTAIVLSAGAGLRLGLAWLSTGGMTRSASLRKSAREAMPVMGAAMVLFFLAALIEGFLSPSAAPLWIKTGMAVLSTMILTFYFVVLGMPVEQRDAT